MQVLGVRVRDGGVHALVADIAATTPPGPSLDSAAPDGNGQAAPPPAPSVRDVPLVGDFAWTVGPVRRCVGQVDDDLRHVPCPTAEPVAVHRQCGPCSGMDDMECIFEPRCANDPASCSCLATFREVPHAVYLAFHGTLPKVGMTTQRRLPWRLREQGADAYLVIAATRDRPSARAIERQVAYVHKVPEHRSHRETLPQLARPVPWEAIEERARQWRSRLAPHYPDAGDLQRVTGHALRQPVGGVPRRVRSEGRHRGTWLGLKGANLVYAEAPRSDRIPTSGPALCALKVPDLVGRRVEVLPTM